MAEEGPGLKYERCEAFQARIQTLARVLVETKGISNHFWEEPTFIDEEGREQNLTAERKDWYLRQLTEIRNLDSAQKEWPYIQWKKIAQECCTVEVLRSFLNEVCEYQFDRANQPLGISAKTFLIQKIPLDLLAGRYFGVGQLEGYPLGKGRTGRLITHPELRVSVDTRYVNWLNRELRTNNLGEVIPQQFVAVTLRKLVMEIAPENSRSWFEFQ